MGEAEPDGVAPGVRCGFFPGGGGQTFAIKKRDGIVPSRGIVGFRILPMVIVVRVRRVSIDYARAEGGGYDEADDDEFDDV